jgi:superfamily II DNA or RNA helicase
MNLRYYQREAMGAVAAGWDCYNSGVLWLGTGAGKTAIAGKLIGQLKGRCLFLADQEELLTQPLRAIQRTSGIIAALEQAKNRASLQSRVVVGSSQTFARKNRRERFRPDHFDYIIVDEAHRGTQRDADICAYFETAKVCGMTATPFRTGVRDLSAHYQTVFYKKPMLDLRAEGFSPPLDTETYPVEIDLSNCRKTTTPDGREYNPDDLDCTITPYLESIARILYERARGRHIIVYLPLIKTSIAFAEILRSVGITARHVDGGSSDREQILEGFDRGEFSCLCNAGVVSIGVDLPRADTYVPLTPMNSPSLYQQRAGRIMRPAPGCIDNLPEKEQSAERKEMIEWSDKPRALVLDFLWQDKKLGVQGPGSLVSEDEGEAKAIQDAARAQRGPVDLDALHKRVQAEREDQLVKALERAITKMSLSKAVTYQQAAYIIGAPADIAHYEPVARWEMDAPTDAQLRVLADAGLDPASIKSKGEASKIMNEIGRRANKRLATMKQIRLLMKLNEKLSPDARYNNPSALTRAEASEIIDTDMARRRAERLAYA